MRNIIAIALILTALSLQAQVVPNATNADNLGGEPATNYVTLEGADYLPKSSGTVIDQNVAEITQIKIDTATERTARITTDDLIAEATKQNKIEIDDNKAVIEELSASTLVLYYTNEVPPSSGYLLMTDTIPAGVESTVVSAMSASTVIVTSFTVETILGLSALRKGLYHSHFHAEMNNTNRDVRLRFEVWNGTGTGETFLFSSEQSNLMTADKTAYDIHVSTDEIITTINYPAIRIVADVTGAAAAPNLTFYMEGDNSSAFEMPALLSDVGVTKIIAGTNIDISPSGGKGDVEVSVKDPLVTSRINHSATDTNTNIKLGEDLVTVASGGKIGIRMVGGTATMYIGDAPWSYLVIGDTDTVYLSTYNYTTHNWSMPHNLTVQEQIQSKNLVVIFGITCTTLTVNQITSGDAGNTDDVYTRFPSSDSWGEPAAGGAGGNKNRDRDIPASSFYILPGAFGNVCSVDVGNQKEGTYDGITSTFGAFYVYFPDTSNYNWANSQKGFTYHWDDADFTLYTKFVTTSTSDGNVWFHVGLTTCPGVGDAWIIFESTTQAGSGWCDTRTSTDTITGTGLIDGAYYYLRWGRIYGDSCAQTIYGVGVTLDPDVD